MLTETEDISLSLGLYGQDHNIDILIRLWNELQTSSVDAAQAPVSSLFDFNETAFFLAVIMRKQKPKERASQSNSPVPETYEKMYGIEYLSDPFNADIVDEEFSRMALDTQSTSAHEPNQHVASFNNLQVDPAIYGGISEAHSRDQSPIGLLFMTSTPHHGAPAGDVNIGIILDAASRGRGYARQAVELVLTWVFEEVKFHRVQAAILDSPEKHKASMLFTKMGFGHEGTRRRAVYSPNEEMWKDATYLAMLDTEWMMRSYFTPAPKSLWDEMFSRHHREREELLRWDDTRSKLRRSSSMETVRDTAPTPDAERSRSSSVVEDPDDAASDAVPLFNNKGKRKVLEPSWDSWDRSAPSPPPPSESSYASCSDESGFESPEPLQIQLGSDVSSARGVVVDPFQEVVTRSSSPESSIGSGDSRWDMLEASSGSSNIDSLEDSD